MSGHSKWSTIKRQKGLTDAKRGQAFTKISNVITIAVKLGGGGDPASNPRLRVAIDGARAVNMPKDNISRAIEKGLGKGKEGLEEVVYEGFGPGHVAFIAEGVTDNRLRTNQEIKNLFERNGGNLGGQGSIVYLFEKKGEIRVKGKVQSEEGKDEEMLELIDLGAADIEDYEEEGIKKFLIYTEPTGINTIGHAIADAGYEIEFQDQIMKPVTMQEITSKEVAAKVMAFAEKLEESDDIQKVFTNFDIAEGIL